MSGFTISPYRVLTENLLQKIGYTPGAAEFSYRESNTKHLLEHESDEGATVGRTYRRITDSKALWNPDIHGLDVVIAGEIENPVFLFRKGGIAPDRGITLGIAVIWTDKDSLVRGSIPVCEIPSDSLHNFEFRKMIHFDPGTVRGTLKIQLVLYVAKTGRDVVRTAGYATTEGTVLGELDEIRLIIEGDGSVFPIMEADVPGDPLWWIETNIEDLMTDAFDEEHFVLILNRAHPNYPDLGLQTPEKDSPLLQEIIADALFTLIMQILSAEGGRDAVTGTDTADPGSMANTVQYMIETNDWQNYLDSPEQLCRAIHRSLEN